MRFSYNPRYNIAYIRFHGKGSEVESIRISDELIVDMAPGGMIYGIELLNANKQLQRENMGRLLVLNEATGEKMGFPLHVG
jgi:uncharacterized protein YuzE